MPALMQKPERAQISDQALQVGRRVSEDRDHRAVDSSSTAIVSDLQVEAQRQHANSAPPVAPPTLTHTSTPAADDGSKPMSTTIFGTHLIR